VNSRLFSQSEIQTIKIEKIISACQCGQCGNAHPLLNHSLCHVVTSDVKKRLTACPSAIADAQQAAIMARKLVTRTQGERHAGVVERTETYKSELMKMQLDRGMKMKVSDKRTQPQKMNSANKQTH
jgi:hypothetical protein